MTSFGEKLRHERESRDTALEEISGTTKIRLEFLEALERNDFAALPGRAFGKFFIRAYAEVLRFDPQELIADYDRELRGLETPGPEVEVEKPARRAWRPRLPPTGMAEDPQEQPATDEVDPAAEPSVADSSDVDSECESVPEPAVLAADDAADTDDDFSSEPSRTTCDEADVTPPPAAATTEEPVVDSIAAASADDTTAEMISGTSDVRSGRPSMGLVSVALAVLVGGAWLVVTFFGSGTARDEPEGPVAPKQVRESTPTRAKPPPEQPAVDPEPQPDAVEVAVPAPAPIEVASPATSNLSVDDFGVGRRIVNRRLEGRTGRFEEGGIAVFSTTVLGGKAGERVRHVWLHDGVEVQSIGLRIGGPHWRTHSSKTLWGLGEWAAEVRDAEDRVLARSTFDCVLAGS